MRKNRIRVVKEAGRRRRATRAKVGTGRVRSPRSDRKVGQKYLKLTMVSNT